MIKKLTKTYSKIFVGKTFVYKSKYGDLPNVYVPQFRFIQVFHWTKKQPNYYVI